MPRPAREIRGVQRGTTPPREIRATIYEPARSTQHTDSSCTIHCPEIFDADKHIAGVDDDQALELSEMFVKQIFDQQDIDLIDVISI